MNDDQAGAGQDEPRRLMLAGMRGRLRRYTEASTPGVRRWTPRLLLAALAAGAFGALLGPDAALLPTSIGVLSSVGGNVLTDLVTSAVDHLRPDASREEAEDELQRRIEEVLAEGGDRAAVLRAAVARVLRDSGAIGELLREESGSGPGTGGGAGPELIVGLTELTTQFAEFRFLLGELGPALDGLRSSVDRNSAQYERVMDAVRRQEATTERVTGYIAAALSGGPPQTRAPAPRPRWVGDCPYRGLAAFREEDAELFHGRARAIEELAGITSLVLADEHPGPAMVMLTGDSGVGKSSLLRAGLLPALAAGAEGLPPETARWPQIVMTPREFGDPLGTLALHLAPVLRGGDQRTLRDRLTADPESMGRYVRQALLTERLDRRQAGAPADGLRLVLVVDQFEELFGVGTPDTRQAAAFVTALRSATTPAAGHGKPPALVVIGMRGDQQGNCSRYEVLRQALQRNQFILGPMEEPDLRRVIVDQAEAAGLEVEPRLVERILTELRTLEHSVPDGGFGAGALPLLSQAMLLTWGRLDGNRLTDHGYELSGGVRGAVETSAERVYAALSPHEQAVAADALRRLALIGPDTPAVSRRVPLQDLPEEAPPVLLKFAERRLVVVGDDFAQPAHQTLLQAWPRLREWLGTDIREWRLHSRLAQDAERWSEDGRNPAHLYQGPLLATMREAERRWRADPGRFPTPEGRQREFLEACSSAETVRVRRRRRLTAAAAVAVVLAVVFGVLAAVAGGRLGSERDAELSRQLARSSAQDADPVEAALLAAAAWRVAPTDEARHGLRAVLAGPLRGTLTGRGAVTAIAHSPDGRTIATGGTDSLIRLWDAASHRPVGKPLAGPAGTVTSLAFSPDGRTLTGAGDDHTVRRWDLRGGRSRARAGSAIAVGDTGPIVLGPGGSSFFSGTRLWDTASGKPRGDPLDTPVSGAAFSSDGRLLATADGARHVRVWDTAVQRRAGPVLTGASGPLAFTPDGKYLVVAAASGGLRLRDLAGRQWIGDRPGCREGTAPSALAVAPAGTTIAVGCGDGSVTLWSLSGRRLLGGPLRGHAGRVDALSFSPDGSALASAGDGGPEVRLWRVGDPLVTSLEDRDGPVAASPDGRYVAAGAPGNGDWRVRLWDVATGRNTALGGLSDWTGALAFSPDGHTVAGAADDRIRIWYTGSGRQLTTLAGAGPVQALAWSADGRSLSAAASEAGFTVRRWDARTGRLLRRLTADVAPGDSLESLGHLTFSPDLRTLATVGEGQSVRLWELGHGRPAGEAMRGENGRVDAVAFSPDGRLLAATGADGTVRLWDTTRRRPLGRPLDGHSDEVSAVAFSGDGRTLASAGRDGTVRLWDTSTRTPLGVPFTGPFKAVRALAFLPGRGALAAITDVPTLDVWRVAEPDDLLGAVCAAAGRPMTRAEWERYAPGAEFRQVCGDPPSGARVLPSAASFPPPGPLESPGPSRSPVGPASAARYAGRYTLVLDGDATRAAFRPEAPAQTHPLQQDLDFLAGFYRGDHELTLRSACTATDCTLRMTGFADLPAVTLRRTTKGTFRGTAGARTWTLRADTVADGRVTSLTLVYEIRDASRRYSGAQGFRGARP
ncbi:hypothetical protein JK359_10250 [Streptomyces actinomycinicus]|uniref:Novel STAND NTPase 1 domain-containing protein n=1 Tax=Streptomyces actinomycinicus TaxID=1695166 RepID=A0A937JKC0_9ACTN|nr:hypothetical protein [Streptomyces actinomycinicus]MBL1082359.1 hypothetical protein [Streptomyces actinomycinicus]